MAVRTDVSVLELESAPARIRGLQRSEHRLLLVIGDSACAAVAVLLALWAWSITTGFAFDAAFLRRSTAWFVLVPLWAALLTGSRRVPAALSWEQTVQSLLGAAVLTLIFYAAAYFYAPPQTLPRLPALYFFWEAILLTLGWRLSYLYVFTTAGFRRRAVVIGTGPAAARIIALLHQLSPDVEVMGAVSDGGDLAAIHVPVYAAADLSRLLGSAGVSEVVVATTSIPPEIVQDLLRSQERGIAVIPMATEYEQLLARVPVSFLPPDWTFTSLSEWVRTRDASSGLKRLVDIAGGLAGLIVLVAVLPLVAFVVWLDSGRPIFYHQKRLGAGGREFDVIKFRSMTPDAEEDGPRWADRQDGRITRAGRWLRRTRLDELPQIISVLRGEMSLVGPRPERPEFVEQLERSIPAYRARLMVRPGLTGWAQVNADYGASADDAVLKLEYDLYYIKHRSFLFDVWILFRTAVTILSLRGR